MVVEGVVLEHVVVKDVVVKGRNTVDWSVEKFKKGS